MDTKFFKTNMNKLRKGLKEGEAALLYSGDIIAYSSDSTYKFRVNKNFYYYTGIDADSAYVLVYKEKDSSEINEEENKTKIKVYYDFTSKELIKWIGEKLTLEKIRENVQNDTNMILPTEYLYDDIISIINNNDIKKLYVEYNNNNENLLNLLYQNVYLLEENDIEIEKLDKISSKHREIKEAVEIEKIKTAINYTKGAINTVMKNIKNCKSEYEAEAYFDFYLAKNNIKNKAFTSIIASGANATTLHYEDNNSEIKENSLLLMDVGAEFDNYAADVSRTIPTSGLFTDEQRKYYEIVLNANKEVINYIKPGMTFKELNDYAKKILSDGLIKDGLIKDIDELEKYYYHSVSHPLGLDTHDLRESSSTIKEGMVITVEPGLYIEEKGIGIRIEDDVLIKNNTVEVLTSSIPKETEEIEKIING